LVYLLHFSALDRWFRQEYFPDSKSEKSRVGLLPSVKIGAICHYPAGGPCTGLPFVSAIRHLVVDHAISS